MKLTVVAVLLPLSISLAACGGSGPTRTAAATQAAPATTTATKIPSREERAKLFAYDAAPPKLAVKGTKTVRGTEVDDVTYSAPEGDVRAYLVRPDGKVRAVVLWMHWFGEESNTNRTEFLPDATALAKDGVLSLLPQGTFPWNGGLSGNVDEDLQSAIAQVVDLRAGLDVLKKEDGDVPVGFVGHDYGAMFGSLLVLDGRPDAYVLMAPDATFANWFVKYLLGGRGSASKYQAAFAPLDPVSNVGDAAPGGVFFQFAKSDPYVPGYIADELKEASADAKESDYDGGHELDAKARADRLAWLREKLGLS
jgi:dienelactone hydrolase/predicted small lipoprotein YifL